MRQSHLTRYWLPLLAASLVGTSGVVGAASAIARIAGMHAGRAPMDGLAGVPLVMVIASILLVPPFVLGVYAATLFQDVDREHRWTTMFRRPLQWSGGCSLLVVVIVEALDVANVGSETVSVVIGVVLALAAGLWCGARIRAASVWSPD